MSEVRIDRPDEKTPVTYPVGQPHWFVMTSLNPQRTDELLAEVNSIRKEEGQNLIQRFIPYQFLKRRIANDNPEDTAEDSQYFNPKNRKDVQANNQLRSLLRRYIFVRAPEAELERLLTAEKTREDFRILWFCLDKSKHRITVPDASMERFINACCDMRLKFEVWPAISGLERNEEVILNTTEFKGQRARVLEVRQIPGGEVELTVGFHIFADTVLVKLRHIRLKDVLSESKTASPTTRESNRYKFIEDTQRKVFSLMNNRKDTRILDQLNTYRYREFETPTLQAKYCALMLLCTVLSNDAHAQNQFVAKAKAILTQLTTATAADKQPHDTIAYLQSALYIATQHQPYRDAATDYFRTLPKLSSTHRHLLHFMYRE